MENLNKKQLATYQLEWAAIYMAVTVVIMLFLPFPIDFIVALFAFLVLSWYRRDQLFRKLDIDPRRNSIGSGTEFRGIKDFFRSTSSSKGSPSTENDYGPVKYYCMKCNNEHREIACPKCGSKMKKVGYCVSDGTKTSTTLDRTISSVNMTT